MVGVFVRERLVELSLETSRVTLQQKGQRKWEVLVRVVHLRHQYQPHQLEFLPVLRYFLFRLVNGVYRPFHSQGRVVLIQTYHVGFELTVFNSFLDLAAQCLKEQLLCALERALERIFHSLAWISLQVLVNELATDLIVRNHFEMGKGHRCKEWLHVLIDEGAFAHTRDTHWDYHCYQFLFLPSCIHL